MKRYDIYNNGKAWRSVDGHWTEYSEAQSEIASLQAKLAAEKALSKDLDGCLQISEDIINAASKRLTKGKREKWGLWYLETIAASRAAYRKARGL